MSRWPAKSLEEIIGLIERLIEAGHAYAVAGDVYFQVRSYPQYGEISHRRRGSDGPGRGSRRGPSSSGTRWISPSGRPANRRRTHRGRRPGVRAGRGGTSSARRWPSSCLGSISRSTGVARPGLPPPRERGRADVRRPGNPAGPGLGPQRDDPPAGGQDGQVRGQHLPAPRGARALGSGRADHVFRSAVTTTSRWSLTRSAWTRPRPAFAGFGRRVGSWARDPRPTGPRASERSFFDALAEDFNTVRALAVVFDWVAQANRSSHAVGSRDLREMLSVLGLENLLEAEGGRDTGRSSGSWAEAQAARPGRRVTTPRLTGSEISFGGEGWELRDGPDGPELLPDLLSAPAPDPAPRGGGS